MTAQELLEYRHEPYRQELVGGRLYEMEPPGAEHGRVAMVIGALLYAHVRQRALGTTFAAETGFQLASDPDTVRAPDVAFVRRERADAVGSPDGYWPGSPDLAVEVTSPRGRASAVEAKALDWLDAGTCAVVVVDPRLRTAMVHRARHDIRILGADEPLELGDVVPGWSPLVGEFFA
jgi:Uma2 family endonuclease